MLNRKSQGWPEKVFKSQMFLSLMSNGGSAAFSFFTFIFLSRLTTPAAFGTWLFFIVLLGVMEVVRTGLLQVSLVRLRADKQFSEAAVNGSAWILALLITAGMLLLSLTAGLVFNSFSWYQPYREFSIWLPLLFCLSLPSGFALMLFQAEGEFRKMLVIRYITSAGFLLWVLLIFFSGLKGLTPLFMGFAAIQLICSLTCAVLGWTGFAHIRTASRELIREMMTLGKYNMGTVLLSNFLRSSDTFLIGLYMSPAAVAAYSVPFRLLELIEMPLRSVVSVFMPRMAKVINQGSISDQRRLYLTYSGILTLLSAPVVILVFLAAEPLVVLIGGPAYSNSSVLLQILIFYALFLPLDRLSGVALDLYGYAALNFRKVWLMLFVNIGGDLIAILVFGDLRAVAAASLLTFLTGLWYGNYCLRHKIGNSVSGSFVFGFQQLRSRLISQQS